MAALLFVYGTLKEGFPNHWPGIGRRLGGRFHTREPLPLVVVRLPGEERAPWLVHRPGEGLRVHGQVFEVDDATLQALDAFEEAGLPTGYLRVEIEVESLDAPAGCLRAHAYLKPPHQLAACLAVEGPYAEYTAELAAGYRLDAPGPGAER